MYVYSFFFIYFSFIFYLLNIFKPLMRCNKYLNKFENFKIFKYHLQPWKMELKKGNDQIDLMSIHLYKINSIPIKLRLNMITIE